jgi:hypothetical protein
MSILAQHDRDGGYQILAEGATPAVAYVPSKGQIKLSVAEGGRELLLYLDIEAARALINAMMGEVHRHKLATSSPKTAKRRPDPAPVPVPRKSRSHDVTVKPDPKPKPGPQRRLLRRQANLPVPIRGVFRGRRPGPP